MRTKLLMIDSGAFSVWTQGAKIDLEEYTEFCFDNLWCSYFVGLDVIPGIPFQKRSLTTESISLSCMKSWANYWMMVERYGFPQNKLIPVFHQNDDIKWLEKYLKCGVEYIGISPANDMTTSQKIKWLKSLKPYLFDGAGRPVVKTHGFAVTSFDLMEYWNWYSVDSASWKLVGAWGGIYLPRTKNGSWDFSQPPCIVAVSPMSPQKRKKQKHATTLSPGILEVLRAYLSELGVCLGGYKVREEKHGYKLDRESKELWYNKEKLQVMEVIVPGVSTSLEERLKVNAHFIRQANKVLPVKHIYFAGAPMPYDLEYDLGRRLLSFEQVGKPGNKCLMRHCKVMGG